MGNYNILSINFNHDGSAAIVSDGRIAAYVNTERFSKIKKHPGLRQEDLDALLEMANLELKNIDVVILCNLHVMDSPDILLMYGTLLKESWFEFWVNQTLDRITINGMVLPCLVNPHHHFLHCALSYYTSPFDEALCFSWDPTGYLACIGMGNKLTTIDYKLKPYDTGRWYNMVATDLFSVGITGAGKVMGLAPYGFNKGRKELDTKMVRTIEDLYQHSMNGNAVYVEERGKKINASLAYDVQLMLERQLVSTLNELYEISSGRGIAANLCLGGGTALNSVANQVGFEESPFDSLYIHPASGDDGTAIGAALWLWFDYMNNERIPFSNKENMYSILTYEDSLESNLAFPDFANRLVVERSDEYISKAAHELADGKIIAWFQGASEIGPRSLGNRSILADPRRAEMKDILNKKVKFRESFRPFAPSVLNEFAEEWFGIKDSPFMLRVCKVLKDVIPAVTHVDNTARIQTVSQDDNKNFYELIREFYKLTSVPVVLNTSFNIKGEPIVETPQDAINCFLNTEIDILVFNKMIIRKPPNS